LQYVPQQLQLSDHGDEEKPGVCEQGQQGEESHDEVESEYVEEEGEGRDDEEEAESEEQDEGDQGDEEEEIVWEEVAVDEWRFEKRDEQRQME
jgi:hypothetical protein